MLRDRLDRDFGKDDNDDGRSEVSGLDDEIDEWAALNKFAILQSYQANQQKKVAAKERQSRIREELEKQQKEFRERQELFKIDQ